MRNNIELVTSLIDVMLLKRGAVRPRRGIFIESIKAYRELFPAYALQQPQAKGGTQAMGSRLHLPGHPGLRAPQNKSLSLRHTGSQNAQ